MESTYTSISDLPSLYSIDDNALLNVTLSGASYKILASVLKQYADGKTAYEYAVEQGYKGTEAQFATMLATLPTYSENAANSAAAAQEAEEVTLGYVNRAAQIAAIAKSTAYVIDTDDGDTKYTMTRKIKNGHFVVTLTEKED